MHFLPSNSLRALLQDSENCCFCDSRDGKSHGIENVVSRSDPDGKKTWWQAESGIENVTIQLDLEGAFYLTHLVMTFKTFRPAALLLERSADHGHSWHVYRYFAHNCSGLFPGIPPAPGHRVGDLVCDQRYSDIEPATEGEVIFQVLDPTILAENTNNTEIQELLRVTNLRVNFSKLHTLGDRPLGGLKGHPFYYYALYELVVGGSCLCHGHASECRPAPGSPPSVEGMVSTLRGTSVAGGRVSQGTRSTHLALLPARYMAIVSAATTPLVPTVNAARACTRTARGRQQSLGTPTPARVGAMPCSVRPHLPWVSPLLTHLLCPAPECECHGHARSCHFDMALYLASGNMSGGVCDACQHNTAGRHCELCQPFFHRDPREDPRSLHSCKLVTLIRKLHITSDLTLCPLLTPDPACDCDPVGALEGGLCDAYTDATRGLLSGQCRCKVHVWGQRCDSCRPGHYGLSLSQSEGCQLTALIARLPPQQSRSTLTASCVPLACRCDARGRVPSTHACDPSSGACHCKRFVSGRDCSRCLPEFWGLSGDSLGCQPCDCDFGGAYSNRCSAGQGLCLCRPHLHGRRCQEPQSGYFCATLDQATAEAERGQSLRPADPRLPTPGKPPALHRGAGSALGRGSDFARVVDGAGLSLPAPPVPRALDYDIVLRYETQAPEVWQALVRVRAQSQPRSARCAHPLPSEQLFQATLTHGHRAVVLSRPFCFEPGTHYSVILRLWRTKEGRRPEGGTILLDSVILLPRVRELPGLRSVDPGAPRRLQELHEAGCLEAARVSPPRSMPEACARLACSISALLHGGGLGERVAMAGGGLEDRGCSGPRGVHLILPFLLPACECHLQGSLSTECAQLGGQCPCRPNITGRTCDRCLPGTFGLGPTGCRGEPSGPVECRCHPEGAAGAVCDPTSGQCTCRAGLAGRRCDRCLSGWWGFPRCQPCACNGHAESCHPLTGVCQDCHGATTGRHCERCLDGYYGDPTLGSGQRCQPCPCPGHPGSGLYHGTSCRVDSTNGRVLCLCAPGYAGPRCDRCSSGYFGHPWPGDDPRRSPCRPCQCNNNIDPHDPAACDPHSGHCQRCLHHSHGAGCAHCRPGFHGSALRPGGCRRECVGCSCDPRGTSPVRCPPGAEACFCDLVSGQCPCRPHTLGRDCSRCAPLFWNLGGPRGCEPCSCHARHTLQPGCHPVSQPVLRVARSRGRVTGQCPCRAGFGGRTCSRCRDGYWGDPEQECRACACDPQGSISPSCDPHTGTCRCREGISGPRCQACARGSTGSFPHCTSCPPCFTSWDQHLAPLQLHLDTVAHEVAALRQGMPGWGAGGQGGDLQALEGKLQQAQTLLESLSPTGRPLRQLTEWITGLRQGVWGH
ncbi:hypothetical protein Celaphus_00010509 [Cervus elaphus hippelaphus]|uniref:Laminin subunit beta-2-like n=1 Tax=Cervus elaphus hippelaphus TaxID=46360 RepID=A0A212C962_CEREH|nr:hypothetical protein Celaphus_00010509 [Cervus elaphus hippelaphus]